MNNQNQEIQVPSFLKKETIERQLQMLEEQRMQQYEMVRIRNEKKIAKRKKEMKRKLVSSAFIAAASFSLGVASVNGYQRYKGSERIANEFNTYTSGYGIDDESNGYHAYYGGREISLDSAFTDIVNDARYGGMSDVEISIGITNVYNKDFALKYVGEVSSDAKKDAKYKAYYEGKLEEYSKTSGGMSK